MSRVADSAGFEKPYRPMPIALLNAAGAALGRVGVGGKPLVVEKLIGEAKNKTGLTEFGGEAFMEPLRVLVDSINAEANLNTVGRMIMRGRLVGMLSNRLRAHAELSAHPEILQSPIDAPLVIAGLQRTGTTMLHRLIARDPGIRSLPSWEAMNPFPLGGGNGKDPRVRQSELATRGLRYMAPDFFAIHPVEPQAPEEEVILLDQTFMSTSAEATLNVPTYAAWLEQQDHTPAYRDLKEMLQYLQWCRSGERWVLKTPHHLEFLDPLLAVFPDAVIIQTHRDPLKTMASFASMVTHARGIFSDGVRPERAALHWLNKIERMVTRAMATRDRVGDENFIDVSYYDLIKDPITEVRRIYQAAGRELTPAAVDAMEASRKVNKKHKYGKHKYGLEDFGLSKAIVEPRIAAYRARFSIPYE